MTTLAHEIASERAPLSSSTSVRAMAFVSPSSGIAQRSKRRCLWDERSQDAFAVRVGAEHNPLDVFNHPFAFAAQPDSAVS